MGEWEESDKKQNKNGLRLILVRFSRRRSILCNLLILFSNPNLFIAVITCIFSPFLDIGKKNLIIVFYHFFAMHLFAKYLLPILAVQSQTRDDTGRNSKAVGSISKRMDGQEYPDSDWSHVSGPVNKDEHFDSDWSHVSGHANKDEQLNPDSDWSHVPGPNKDAVFPADQYPPSDYSSLVGDFKSQTSVLDTSLDEYLLKRCKILLTSNIVIDQMETVTPECLQVLKDVLGSTENGNLLQSVTVSDWRLLTEIPVSKLQVQFIASISGGQRLEEFRKAIAASPQLSEIIFNRAYFQADDTGIFHHGLGASKSIRKISLIASTLTDEAARALSQFLANRVNLESLEISDCAISDHGWRGIMAAILVNPYLRSLTLKEYSGPVVKVARVLATNRLHDFTFSSGLKCALNRRVRSSSSFSGFLSEPEIGAALSTEEEFKMLVQGLQAASRLETMDLTMEIGGLENDLVAAIESKHRLRQFVLRATDLAVSSMPEIQKILLPKLAQKLGSDGWAKLMFGGSKSIQLHRRME